MEWMHNCHHVSVWNYSAWFIDSELVKFCILLPVSYSCVCAHMCLGKGSCAHTERLGVFCPSQVWPREIQRGICHEKPLPVGFFGEPGVPRVEVSIGKVFVCLCGRQKRRWFQPFPVTVGTICPSWQSSFGRFTSQQGFILFSYLFPQVCLYGGYNSAERPGKETVSPPSERTSHGDQIWAGNLTKGGSLDNGI